MKILFQGDSITDVGRSRDNDGYIGSGYPLLVKAHLGYHFPGEYEFFNRGISGNRIVDLYARIKCDIINIKPDIMSILIGVNDVWHEYSQKPNGVSTEKFFKIYSMLIEEIRAELPDIKIIIMEPFSLKGSGNESVWEEFDYEVRERAKMAKKIADTYGLTFVKLQEQFDELCQKQDASYWLGDGVHPTPMGHEFIKEQWLKAFNSL